MPEKRAEEKQFLISYDSGEEMYRGQLLDAPGTAAKGRTADACIQAVMEKVRSQPHRSGSLPNGHGDGQMPGGESQTLVNELRDNLAAVGMILDLLKMKLSRSGQAAEFVKDVEAARTSVTRTREGIKQLAGKLRQ